MKLLKDHVNCCCCRHHRPSNHSSIVLITTFLLFLALLSPAGLTTLGASGTKTAGGGVKMTTTSTMLVGRVPKIESLKPNTTAFVGQTAYLQCIVKHLGDKTVSWIRRKDLHILTSGNHVYTSDPRVSLLRQGKISDGWTLKITQIRKRDEGQYECQVNTEPKSTYTFHLIVVGTGASNNEEVEMKAAGWRLPENLSPPFYQHDSIANPTVKITEARILGLERLEIEEGSTANFTCIISHPGLAAPNVTWYYNDIPVKQSSAILGGINIETEKSLFSTISKLVIVRVDPRNQGKYSCGGSAIYPASVLLRIHPDRSSRHVNELASRISSSAGAGPSRSLDFRDKGGTWLAITLMMVVVVGVLADRHSSQDSSSSSFSSSPMTTLILLAIPFFMLEHIILIKILAMTTLVIETVARLVQ